MNLADIEALHAEIRCAARRINGVAVCTPLLTSAALDTRVGSCLEMPPRLAQLRLRFVCGSCVLKLGEERSEITQALQDLHDAGTDIITITRNITCRMGVTDTAVVMPYKPATINIRA
jgi:lipoate synthase